MQANAARAKQKKRFAAGNGMGALFPFSQS